MFTYYIKFLRCFALHYIKCLRCIALHYIKCLRCIALHYIKCLRTTLNFYVVLHYTILNVYVVLHYTRINCLLVNLGRDGTGARPLVISVVLTFRRRRIQRWQLPNALREILGRQQGTVLTEH